ncbi:MAG: hypothetical protein LC795_02390 [Acidobacteria bacterium]|nr:hypothetical protein [Acidobacteriota bacterium]
MRTRSLEQFARVLALCLLAPRAASAQATPAPDAPAQRLAVQVEYFKGAKPAFQPVPRDSWYGHFATVATPQPRAAADTVRAVHVRTRAGEGGRVEVRVGVHVGARHFDRLEAVATYHAAVGETVTAGELERVGVAPFVFKVLGVNETAAAPPSVQNMTQSIEAFITDFTPGSLPHGKMTLRNLSTKRVRAVYLRQVVEGRNRLQGFVTEREGKMLIEPGGSAEKVFGATTGEPSASGFLPAAVESLVIDTVVFEDYTFEGEPERAAMKRALIEGERAQLQRLLALIRQAHNAPAAGAPAAARAFRGRLLALGDPVPQAAVAAILKDYPGLHTYETAATSDPSRWGSVVEISMHGVRRDLLNDLERFEKVSQSSPQAGGFKGWLKQWQARYEAWLSRL